MIVLISSSLFSLFLFLILGISASKCTKLTFSIIDTLLTGMVIANTLTSIISLFSAINLSVFIGFIILCSCLCFYIKQELKHFLLVFKSNKYSIYWSLPFIIIATLVAIGPITNYDTGLYHLQAINWIETYKVVPGLANIHGRFGFNPNCFTLSALTSFKAIFNEGIYSLNYTILIICIIYYINKLVVLYFQKGVSFLLLFYAIILYTILGGYRDLTSPSPDFIVLCLPLYVISRLIEINIEKKYIILKDYIPLLLICVYILTVKLSTLPILIIFIYIIFSSKLTLKRSINLSILVVLIALPWLVRNIIISGWLIYPAAVIDIFNPDWKVPIEQVINEKNAVTGWARNPGEHYLEAAKMNIHEWFPIWWDNQDVTLKRYLLVCLLLPIFSTFTYFFIKKQIPKTALIIVLTGFLGSIFWFNMAPTLRFGESFLLIAALSPLIFLIFSKPYYGFIKHKLGFLVIIFFLAFTFQKNALKLNYNEILKNVVYLSHNPVFIDKPTDLTFFSKQFHGFSVNVPSTGDRCFDCPLPCTPYPDTNLVLRGATFKDGFKTNNNRN